VAAVRRLLGERRVGHAGTLDPAASGLLLVLVGRATRLARFTAVLPKRYDATLRLGAETATDDATGAVTATDETWRGLDEAAVRRALAEVAARGEQVPPAVSAKKVAGERAYRLARRGEPADLRPVAVRIHRLEVRRVALPDVDVAVECSAGTYVRAIARDAGRALGTRGHLAALRRTGIGPWTVLQGVPLRDATAASLAAALRPLAEVVAHLPRLDLDPETAERVRHGGKVEADAVLEGPVALSAAGELLAVAEYRDGRYVPSVVLVP
jgi:tRNA pseudouridine55 synthase